MKLQFNNLIQLIITFKSSIIKIAQRTVLIVIIRHIVNYLIIIISPLFILDISFLLAFFPFKLAPREIFDASKTSIYYQEIKNNENKKSFIRKINPLKSLNMEVIEEENRILPERNGKFKDNHQSFTSQEEFLKRFSQYRKNMNFINSQDQSQTAEKVSKLVDDSTTTINKQ
jgi:hypothetical protein